MFRRYCHVVARGDGSSMTIRSSLQPGVYQEHMRQRPLWAFDLPMDGLSRTGGIIQCSEADALQQAADSGLDYWEARCYRNYSGGLSFYVSFGDYGVVHHYQLIMPVNVHDDTVAYPTPGDYYLATGKVYVGSFAAEEFTAMGGG